jgi:hypothetical protein
MTPPHSAPPSGCDADATCAAGKNGRCYTPVSGCGCAPNICTYDECFSDADCADGSPCECRAAFAYEANVCVKNGNCRVDTDCGAAGYCSPSGVSNCMTAYFCHTPDDECVDAADCSGDRECAFDAAAKRWKCGPGTCGPVG